ncbi:hypothetical protein YC2023_040067 [Brassica napus]
MSHLDLSESLGIKIDFQRGEFHDSRQSYLELTLAATTHVQSAKWVKIISVPQSERNMQIISSEISFILTISSSFHLQSHSAKVYFRKLDVLLAAEELPEEYKIVR